jgi:hypothetical protein
MAALLSQPLLIILFKLILPILAAWATPGRWLRPAIILLALVLIWNIRGMILFV